MWICSVLRYYSCDSQEISTVVYDYSPIVCQISGGNQQVSATISQLQSYNLFLDGDTFTFDPDADSILNKSHLSFHWNCTRFSDSEISSCEEIFSADDISKNVADFATQNWAPINSSAQCSYELIAIVLNVSFLCLSSSTVVWLICVQIHFGCF